MEDEDEELPPLTPEQLEQLEEIKKELQADMKAIDAHILRTREVMAQRLIAPRMQKIVEMFNTGVDANGGLVWVNDAELRQQPIIERICHEISDHFWERLLPADAEGHAYVANSGDWVSNYDRKKCRVCGKSEERHNG